MNRIQVLSEEVISKISAGEVVERPASVVKELVENSLDAGAKNIVIEIKNAGKKLIRVSDDGSGMSKEELPLALERYATSKISSLLDLKRINTLGFRGEALPSIAAVSKFILISRKENSNNGYRIYAESGKIKENYETGSPVGTTVEVKDLFYNTPARLKFLKTDSTEKEQIFNIIYDLALAYPETSFRLIDEEKEVLNCPGVDNPKSRIAQLFGYQILEYLFPFTETINFYKISGFLSYP
ncbi:MAG TPA: DNA mismatch repair protein MutL, partial [Elusimicrobia bacterium]|nr:DNA mismatch repair protein MutL [Elusimicrobiota bacterium]